MKSKHGSNVSHDTELINWLRQQPGVVEHTVHVRRHGRTVHVDFIQVRNLSGDPSVPALDVRAQELGYKADMDFATRIDYEQRAIAPLH